MICGIKFVDWQVELGKGVSETLCHCLTCRDVWPFGHRREMGVTLFAMMAKKGPST